ncbi:MAG: hypothetical protein WCK31_00685, partial [bacterium]
PSAYFFGLPTCVMGLIFFVAIFIAAIIFKKKIKGLALPFIPFLSIGLLCGLIWGQLVWDKIFFFW